ncbi:MAG: SUMF1/EgtB/PvdO family nonheme iron enzyme [Candidatus Hydrogenedentes bacterium]|nr:SUMF1/EgtB/PvdO family nonheme iron enzyme [Candidatus Hydrogenedentota bacterium]
MKTHVVWPAITVIAAILVGMETTWADFHVSLQGSDDFSGTLPQPNAGGTDGPFATLERARDAVRAIIAEGLTSDVTIYLEEGRYYLPETFSLGSEDSGTTQHAITYRAIPGAEVLLIGGTLLTDWQQYREDIHIASLPEGLNPQQLFENGARMDLARSPDVGYHYVELPGKAEDHADFTYEAGTLSPEDWDVTAASVCIFPTYDWSNAMVPIASVDATTRTIVLGGKVSVTPGNRYFVRNVLALLDRPGDCRIDLAARKVYFWPRKLPIDEQTIIASRLNSLITIQGASPDNPVRNVHFRDLNLSVAEHHAVVVQNAASCSIRGCLIENSGGNGILVSGHVEDLMIRDNLVRHTGGCGVELTGLGSGESAPEDRPPVTVENNHIHHTGELASVGSGVSITLSGRNRIAHNLIHDAPRWGINMCGNGQEGDPSCGNQIVYNHIHHVNLDTQDTGAFYAFISGHNNLLDHNLIHDTGNEVFGLQSGIYIDDASDFFTVTNNLVYDVIGAHGDAQPIFVKGVHNVIANNVLIVGPGSNAAIRSFAMGGHCDRHEYTRNVIVFEGASGAIYDFNDWCDDRLTSADFNLFWKPGGELALRGGPAKSGKSKLAFGSLDQWKSLFDGRFDQHSLVADPLFVNAEHRDFRLQPDSPALTLGFVPIDTAENAGLAADFPARLRDNAEQQTRDYEKRTFTNSIGMKMRLIPAGTFTMGSEQGDDDEKPVHEVTITKSFYLGVYEVTQAEYQAVMGDNPSRFNGALRPVDQVTFENAEAFCRKLSEMEGATYRLPTEAEWEYACRAGTRTKYYWGDEFQERYAWAAPNSGARTHDAGSRTPNPWGLFDMSGNVWEWCGGWYGPYDGSAQTDPQGPPAGTYRIVRGGDWEFGAQRSRSAQRYWQDPNFLYGTTFGFRVVEEATP